MVGWGVLPVLTAPGFSQGPASHSHKKVGFRVTVGRGGKKSKKGERSTSQRKPAVSLDKETGFQYCKATNIERELVIVENDDFTSFSKGFIFFIGCLENGVKIIFHPLNSVTH